MILVTTMVIASAVTQPRWRLSPVESSDGTYLPIGLFLDGRSFPAPLPSVASPDSDLCLMFPAICMAQQLARDEAVKFNEDGLRLIRQGEPTLDFNQDGVVNSQDVFDFTAAFWGGGN